MKTCRDCIHFDICDVFNIFNADGGMNFEFKTCNDFKDEAKFIKLPCIREFLNGEHIAYEVIDWSLNYGFTTSSYKTIKEAKARLKELNGNA